MLMNVKKILGLPVKTKAGINIGKVFGLEIDVDTGKISIIQVRSPGMFLHLMDDLLMVSWSQIVSISENEVIIVDAVIPVGSRVLVKGMTN